MRPSTWLPPVDASPLPGCSGRRPQSPACEFSEPLHRKAGAWRPRVPRGQGSPQTQSRGQRERREKEHCGKTCADSKPGKVAGILMALLRTCHESMEWSGAQSPPRSCASSRTIRTPVLGTARKTPPSPSSSFTPSSPGNLPTCLPGTPVCDPGMLFVWGQEQPCPN